MNLYGPLNLNFPTLSGFLLMKREICLFPNGSKFFNDLIPQIIPTTAALCKKYNAYVYGVDIEKMTYGLSCQKRTTSVSIIPENIAKKALKDF